MSVEKNQFIEAVKVAASTPPDLELTMTVSGLVMLGSLFVILMSISQLFSQWIDKIKDITETPGVNSVPVVKFPIHLFYLTIGGIMTFLGSGLIFLSHF
tara:strand:- start:771 stop:1067 length:297 start_codon:yes stop_codon:yes gene_type:complete